MKKLFAILAVAVVAVACNNGGENKGAADSTTVVTPDTAIVAPVTPDTTVAPIVDTTMHHDSTATH